MNKFFKYFPVAMAMATLASCSSDDLVGVNENVPGYELSENDILVMMDEGLMTRAAFGEMQVYANGTTGVLRSIFFTPGDEIKLYDDLNWRPQTFVYNEDATLKLYHFKPGDVVKGEDATKFTSVFTSSPNNPEKTSENTYENGYGVYPANLSTFEGELRENINFDMSSLAFIKGEELDSEVGDFNTTLPNTDAEKTLVRRTAIPMWGNLGETVVNQKVVEKAAALRLVYLTGFIRVGITSKAAQADKQAWLVIRSTKEQLTGNYRAEGFDYTEKVAPVLKGQQTNVVRNANYHTDYVYANPTANAQKKGGYDQNGTLIDVNTVTDLKTDNGTGIIVMELPKLAGDMDEVIYVPVPKGEYPLSIHLVMGGDNETPDVLDLTDAKELLNEDNFDKIKENGDFYNLDLYDDSNELLNTPYGLANFIKKFDEIGRNITVTVNQTIYVRGNRTPQDMNLYVGQLDHDVTVNLKGGLKVVDRTEDVKDHTPSIYITKSGKGKLTLNLGLAEDETDSKNYPVIVIRETGTDNGNYTVIKSSNVANDEGGIVINGIKDDFVLPKIVVETEKDVVTLKTGAEVVNLKGRMIIDAKDKTIDQLNIKEDGSVLTLNNGTITTVVTDGVKTATTENVTINSKGKSFIKNIRTAVYTGNKIVDTWEDANSPVDWQAETNAATNHGDYKKLDLNSEWDGEYYPAGTPTTLAEQQEIHTAAQFAMGGYVANTHLHTNLFIGKTLDGSEATTKQKNWKGLILEQNFDGAGKNVELVTNYNGSNNIGLFSEIMNNADAAQITVKHLNLKADVQPADGTYRAQIGALAGNVVGKRTGVKFSRIVLDEGNKIGYFELKPNYTYVAGSKIGGMIGNATGTVTIENSSAKGTVAGFAALGGYIGQVSDQDTQITFGLDSNANNAGTETNVNNADYVAFTGKAWCPATSEVKFNETRTVAENLYNVDYGTIGMFVGKIADNKAKVLINRESAVVSNDKIAGKEKDLLFHKNHIVVGKDQYGNDKYYNYCGSYRNVVGYSSAATATDQIQVRESWNVSPWYATYTLLQRKANQKNEEVSGIETYYFNWFAPETAE